MEEAEEGRLLEALRRDLRGAFPALVARYEGRIYSFAARMCRSAEDARDVLQETFLAAFRALDRFRGEGRLTTWLFRIAANACLKMRRRPRFEAQEELPLEAFLPGSGEPAGIGPGADDPERRLLTAELREALERGIAELPEPYRVVLVLRDVEGFPAEEVARILDLSVPAVKSRLHRARLFLRRYLAEHAPGRPA